MLDACGTHRSPRYIVYKPSYIANFVSNFVVMATRVSRDRICPASYNSRNAKKPNNSNHNGSWWTIRHKSLSPSVFEIFGIKHIGVTTLTFLGHVTSSVA